MQGLYTALIKLEDAWLNMATIALTTDTTDVTNLNVAWSQTTEAEYRMSRGIAYLWDVNPVTAGAACGANRAACVALANAEFTLAVTAFNAAKDTGGNGATACKTTGSTASIRSACTSLESALTQAATGAGTTYNSALTYTNPHNDWYDKCVSAGAPGCVYGPHGDFDLAVYEITQGIDQVRTSLDGMRQAWNWPVNGEAVWGSAGSTSNSCTPTLANQVCAWSRLLVRMGNIVGKMHNTLMAYAMIPYPGANTTNPGNATYHQRAALSPFFLVANVFEFLLSNHSASQSRTHCCEGLPYHYPNMVADSFTVLIEALSANSGADRPTSRPIFFTAWEQVTVQSWFHSDGSFWRSFQFPSDAVLVILRTNPSQLNDPNGPPTTYYYE